MAKTYKHIWIETESTSGTWTDFSEYFRATSSLIHEVAMCAKCGRFIEKEGWFYRLRLFMFKKFHKCKPARHIF